LWTSFSADLITHDVLVLTGEVLAVLNRVSSEEERSLRRKFANRALCLAELGDDVRIIPFSDVLEVSKTEARSGWSRSTACRGIKLQYRTRKGSVASLLLDGDRLEVFTELAARLGNPGEQSRSSSGLDSEGLKVGMLGSGGLVVALGLALAFSMSMPPIPWFLIPVCLVGAGVLTLLSFLAFSQELPNIATLLLCGAAALAAPLGAWGVAIVGVLVIALLWCCLFFTGSLTERVTTTWVSGEEQRPHQ
jgi:hypothetical protein